MKKGLFTVCSLVIIVAVAGCTGVEIRKIVKDRVDIQVQGNQGVIFGPTPAPYQVKQTTREIIEIDIEMARVDELRKPTAKSNINEPAPDKESWGNAGVLDQGEIEESSAPELPARQAEPEPVREEKIK